MILVLMIWVVRATKLGRYVFAYGRPEAARLAGINTRLLTTAVFALMGTCAGLAGAIHTEWEWRSFRSRHSSSISRFARP